MRYAYMHMCGQLRARAIDKWACADCTWHVYVYGALALSIVLCSGSLQQMLQHSACIDGEMERGPQKHSVE